MKPIDYFKHILFLCDQVAIEYPNHIIQFSIVSELFYKSQGFMFLFNTYKLNQFHVADKNNFVVFCGSVREIRRWILEFVVSDKVTLPE